MSDTTERISEAEISMVLNTFMYLDYKEAREGTTLREIVADLETHPDYGGGGLHYGEYTVLKEASLKEEVGSLEIGYQSVNMGYDTGTAACIFSAPDGQSVYVVYRGTGDGEWPDNGLGMTASVTPQQERALAYFEETVAAMGIDDSQRLVVTGHSKGGNKAQFVTMETEYDALIDVCYSVDGQGFSQAAIKRWQTMYGQKGYEQRTARLYGIYGENDYVSVLGNSIVPKEQIRYVKTPVEKENFAGYHDIKYMFASLDYDEMTNEAVTTFGGRKNSNVENRGVLGDYAGTLSAMLMALPPEKRDGCAAVVMQLMEMGRGSKRGINGEKLTLGDLGDFFLFGIPVIAGSVFLPKEGQTFWAACTSAPSFGGGLPGNVVLEADCLGIRQQAVLQREAASALKKQAEEIRCQAEKIPAYLKGGIAVYHQLKLSAGRLDQVAGQILRIVQVKEEIAGIYEKWDQQ